MTSDFNIGDRVEAIDDLVRGQVVRLDGGRVIVESDDGFEWSFAPEELVVLGGHKLDVSKQQAANIAAEENKPGRKSVAKRSNKDRYLPTMEVDLHVEKLIRDPRGLAKHDLLNLQVDTAQRQLEFALRKGIQKIVFIHGVGAGTLKEELKYLFNRYPGIRFYDADYQRYGMGATEVFISQKA